jgi:DNA-binding FadR family transcriptional regulator
MPPSLPGLKDPLLKRTMREQIAGRIARMIQSGLLRIGDELPSERELAQTLDVSRETVRGALQMLATIGMVEISQGARTRVVRPDGFGFATLAEMIDVARYGPEEVYQARRLIEIWVAEEAARRIEEPMLERLRRLIAEQQRMTGDPVRFQISDAEFHQVIYRSSGNALLTDFLHDVYSYALAYRRQAILVPGAVAVSVDDHALILAALEARDAEAAGRAMDRHLLHVHQTTLQVMGARTNTAS